MRITQDGVGSEYLRHSGAVVTVDFINHRLTDSEVREHREHQIDPNFCVRYFDK